MIGKQLRALRLPDFLTLAGLLSSFGALFLLWKDPMLLPYAYLCILGQIFADFWDGRIARRMGIQDSLGVHLDNFSDFLTILATAALGWTMIGNSILGFFCFAFFVIAAAVRLAYFTVSNAGRHLYFVGIPTTATSFVLSGIVILDHSFFHFHSAILLGFYLLGGLGMIAGFQVRKL